MTKLVVRVDAVEGEHVKVSLFMGEEGKTLANVGALSMRVGEYQLFAVCLSLGAERWMTNHLIVEHDDAVFLEHG